MNVASTERVVGLRVDVDTFRGTRLGVPALLDALSEHAVSASIFFSVGPDNMGRHLWRLVNPCFFVKMLRSNAANLYGWDILLRGTIWPGPRIGQACTAVIARAADCGHEIGLHAWDHHYWQTRLDTMSYSNIVEEHTRGMAALGALLREWPRCSAAAGWRCNESVLRAKESDSMLYNSDCRGTCIFRPLIEGKPGTPQIPVTLPTYDELAGRNGVNDENYNDYLFQRIRRNTLNVLTVHAEVEGIAKHAMFRRFLRDAATRGIRFVPLGSLLQNVDQLPVSAIRQGRVAGRAGLLCMQAES